MEHRTFILKADANTGTASFGNLALKCAEKFLNIAPADVRTGGILKDCFKRLALLLVHFAHSHHGQAAKYCYGQSLLAHATLQVAQRDPLDTIICYHIE